MEDTPLFFLQKNWDRIATQASRIDFKAGQTIFYEGHYPYGVFVILKGKAQLVPGLVCPTPNSEHLERIPQGTVIGFSNVLEGTPSCCSCVAASDCETLFFSKTLLLPFLRHDEDQVR